MTTDDVLKEINEASFDIPFENSAFQTDSFVLKGQYTPARAYRALLLRMNNRIQALNEAKYSLAKEDIDIEELRSFVDSENKKEEPNTFSIRRWELDVAQKEEKRMYTKKLVHDALVEVSHLYAVFKRFPKYTREQFEAEEKEHFRISLERQVSGLAGAASSLLDICGLPGVPDKLLAKEELTERIFSDASVVDTIDGPKDLPA